MDSATTSISRSWLDGGLRPRRPLPPATSHSLTRCLECRYLPVTSRFSGGRAHGAPTRPQPCVRRGTPHPLPILRAIAPLNQRRHPMTASVDTDCSGLGRRPLPIPLLRTARSGWRFAATASRLSRLRIAGRVLPRAQAVRLRHRMARLRRVRVARLLRVPISVRGADASRSQEARQVSAQACTVCSRAGGSRLRYGRERLQLRVCSVSICKRQALLRCPCARARRRQRLDKAPHPAASADVQAGGTGLEAAQWSPWENGGQSRTRPARFVASRRMRPRWCGYG